MSQRIMLAKYAATLKTTGVATIATWIILKIMPARNVESQNDYLLSLLFLFYLSTYEKNLKKKVLYIFFAI